MEKDNNYINHFLIIGSGTIINMLLGFIITPIITRIVDPSYNGMMSLFTLYGSIAVMTLSLGLDQAFVRFFYDRDDEDYKKKLLKTCIIFPIIFTVIFSLLFIVCFNVFPKIFEFEKIVLWLLIFYVFVSLVNRFSLLVLRVQYKSKTFALCNIFNRLVYLIVSICLIETKIVNPFIALIIATLSSVFVSTLIAIYNSKEIWSFSTSNVQLNKKELFSYSLPLVISAGLSILFQGIDKLSLNYFCTYNEIGIYAAAISIVSIVEIAQTTFNTIWSPLQMEQYTKNKDHKQYIAKVCRYITVIMFTIGFILIMFKGIFALFLGEKYRDAAFVLPFLTFYPIMYTLSEVTQVGIGFTKKTHLLVIVVLVCCVVNLCGNFYLIPRIGYKGAAISTGISYVVYFCLNTLISRKLYYIDFKIWKIIILVIEYIIFSFLNTFNFSLTIRIAMFVIGLLTMFILYKDTIVFLINQGILYIKKRTSR